MYILFQKYITWNVFPGHKSFPLEMPFVFPLQTVCYIFPIFFNTLCAVKNFILMLSNPSFLQSPFISKTSHLLCYIIFVAKANNCTYAKLASNV